MKELKAIINDIQKNQQIYDFKLVNNLISKIKEELQLCIKTDEDFFNFFRSSKNFRVKADLIDFSKKKLNHKIIGKTKAEIQGELAKISKLKNISKAKLHELLGKPPISISKPKISVKKSVKKIKIKDQTSLWMNLSENQLRDELNNLQKYPDSKSLKQAAYSIIKSNERRLRLREKIINIIVKRILEEKAITHLGR